MNPMERRNNLVSKTRLSLLYTYVKWIQTLFTKCFRFIRNHGQKSRYRQSFHGPPPERFSYNLSCGGIIYTFSPSNGNFCVSSYPAVFYTKG